MKQSFKKLLGMVFLSILFLLGTASYAAASNRIPEPKIGEHLSFGSSDGILKLDYGFSNHAFIYAVDNYGKVEVSQNESDWKTIKKTFGAYGLSNDALNYFSIESDGCICIGKFPTSSDSKVRVRISAKGYETQTITIGLNRGKFSKVEQTDEGQPSVPSHKDVEVTFYNRNSAQPIGSIKVKAGSRLSDATGIPAIENLKHWFLLGERKSTAYNMNTRVYSPISLFACREYTVNFKKDPALSPVKVIKVLEDDSVAQPSASEYPEVAFWYDTKLQGKPSAYNFKSRINQDLTLAAVLKKQFTVTFKYDKKELNETVFDGAEPR